MFFKYNNKYDYYNFFQKKRYNKRVIQYNFTWENKIKFNKKNKQRKRKSKLKPGF